MPVGALAFTVTVTLSLLLSTPLLVDCAAAAGTDMTTSLVVSGVIVALHVDASIIVKFEGTPLLTLMSFRAKPVTGTLNEKFTSNGLVLAITPGALSIDNTGDVGSNIVTAVADAALSLPEASCTAPLGTSMVTSPVASGVITTVASIGLKITRLLATPLPTTTSAKSSPVTTSSNISVTLYGAAPPVIAGTSSIVTTGDVESVAITNVELENELLPVPVSLSVVNTSTELMSELPTRATSMGSVEKLNTEVEFPLVFPMDVVLRHSTV